jgi:hypothetical protein
MQERWLQRFGETLPAIDKRPGDDGKVFFVGKKCYFPVICFSFRELNFIEQGEEQNVRLHHSLLIQH